MHRSVCNLAWKEEPTVNCILIGSGMIGFGIGHKAVKFGDFRHPITLAVYAETVFRFAAFVILRFNAATFSSI